MNKPDAVSILKTAALLEGLSLIGLVMIAVPVKYLLKMPLLVKIIGPIHGILFLAFIAILLWCFLKHRIDFKQTVIGILASFVPFGTFVYKKKIL